jgi:hypothetical protein
LLLASHIEAILQSCELQTRLLGGSLELEEQCFLGHI